MKRVPLLLILAACGTALLPLHADDQTRQVQEELKGQGFFFGEVDGQSSSALTAAVKRFQIRNGLDGTGQVDDATLQALGLAEAPAPAPGNPPPLADVPAQPTDDPAMQPAAPAENSPAPAPDAPEPPPASSRGPVNLRRGESPQESDRRYLREEENRGTGGMRPPSSVRPPAHLGPAIDAPANIGPQGAAPDPRLSQVFAGTPYSTAPAPVQRDTVRRAQQLLSQRRIYRAAVDGIPGPAMEEALLLYQRALRLPATGQLDLETLGALRLLPGRAPGNPALKPFGQPGPSRSSGSGFIR